MGEGYRVECVAPEAAREDLQRLWGANLTVAGTAEHKFRWLYRDAPDRPDAVFLLAEDDSAVPHFVGTAGVGIRRMRVLGHDRRAGLLADIAVDRDHRTLLPALTLARTVKAWTLATFDLAYGFPNRHAQLVFKGSGYRTLGRIGRWVRVLRHASYAQRFSEIAASRAPPPVRDAVVRALNTHMFAALAGGAVDALRSVQSAPARLRAARALELAWLDAPDERIDAVWGAAQDEYKVVGVRSACFLRWRFPPSPRLSVVVASRRDGGRGTPVAYAVIERDGATAHVRDLFGRRGSVPALLDLLPAALRARGASAVSMRYLGARWLVDALELRGWSRRPDERTIAIAAGDRLSAGEQAAITDPEPWHLMDADEDT